MLALRGDGVPCQHRHPAIQVYILPLIHRPRSILVGDPGRRRVVVSLLWKIYSMVSLGFISLQILLLVASSIEFFMLCIAVIPGKRYFVAVIPLLVLAKKIDNSGAHLKQALVDQQRGQSSL